MWAVWLDHTLKAKGSGVKVVCAHPGVVATNLYQFVDPLTRLMLWMTQRYVIFLSLTSEFCKAGDSNTQAYGRVLMLARSTSFLQQPREGGAIGWQRIVPTR